jgi:hypothetical protein
MGFTIAELDGQPLLQKWRRTPVPPLIGLKLGLISPGKQAGEKASDSHEAKGSADRQGKPDPAQ